MMNCMICDNENLSGEEKKEFSIFIMSQKPLKLDTDDFMKRKRITSNISIHERCRAKKASSEQCTRKKKDNCSFCGTHEKSQPHGSILFEDNKPKLKKYEIIVKEIQGIHHYIDNFGNVYDTADIISNVQDPKIIAKYSIVNGIYHIV